MDYSTASLTTEYDVDSTFDSDKFLKLRMKVCHDGENYNYSSLSLDSMRNASESIKNVPVLAHVIFDDNGKPQFGGHDSYIDVDPTGENWYREVYEEVPIGVVPETNNYTIEEVEGRFYVFVDAYVWRDYSNLAEHIIKRDKEIKLSMEIKVNKYEIDQDDPIMHIIDYKYCGITFLGNHLETGMKNTKATLLDYSKETKDNFEKLQKELSKELMFAKNSTEEFMKDKLQLISEFGLSVEELEFEIEELSYEELEAKLKDMKEEKFEEEAIETPENEENFEEEADDKSEFDDEDADEDFEGAEGAEEGSENSEEEFEEGSEEESEESFEEESEEDDVDFEAQLKELQSKFDELTSEYNEYKESHAYENSEVEELREFKNNSLVDEVLGEFDDLVEVEEFEALKKEAYNYENLEALKEKCFAIRGKHTPKFEKSDSGLVSAGLVGSRTTKEEYEPYGGIIKHYKGRK